MTAPVAVEKGGLKLSYWGLGVIAFLFICCLLIVGLAVHYGERGGSVYVQSTTETPTTRRPAHDWLLPDDVMPLSYRLKIQTYLPSSAVKFPEHKRFTFNGEVTILIQCQRATDRIVMNLKKLRLLEETLSLTGEDGQHVEFGTPPFELQPEIERVTFLLRSTLVPSKRYLFSVHFDGTLSTGLGGYYRSKYVEKGETKWLAVTHFECCRARMALPCFDDPKFKAQFNVTMVHPKDMVALSNQIPVSSEVSSTGWNSTVFAPTPKMSSYLLAFSVNAFTHRSDMTKSNPPVLFRVWSAPNSYKQTEFSTAAGPVVLDYYAQMFNQAFPLKKQDMLALPDFAAGAMENWGLVTYRETALLYEPTTSWQTNKDRVAEVVAHELAHQWFGDLVTMKWWSDLWLNEGFATLFQYYGAGVIMREAEHMEEIFPVDKVQRALRLDQMSTSHAIYDPYVFSPSEIESVFDAISYDKGGTLLRMLHHLLKANGKDAFILSLRYYLQKHKYSNADHNDLWNAMDHVVRQEQPLSDWDGKALNVTVLMNPWVEQQGYPLVTVKREGNTIALSQQRFLLDKTVTSATNFTWYIPMWYIQPKDKEAKMVWMKKDAPAVVTLASSQPVIVNYKQLAFCRVNYDDASWSQITQLLKTNLEAIDVINRAQILDDAMNLARKGTISYTVALGLTSYLTAEPSYLPWMALGPSLSFIEKMMSNRAEFVYYQKYMTKVLTPAYQRLPTEKNEFMRHIVFQKACQMGMPSCLTEAKHYFQAFVSDCKNQAQSSLCSRVPPYYRQAIYCAGVGQGGDEEFKLMWQLYGSETQAVEKVNLLFGICCTKQVHLIAKLLEESIIRNSTIRKQDVMALFLDLAANPVAQGMIWNFFVSNIDTMLQTHGENIANMRGMIEAATISFNTEYQVKEMEMFSKQYPDLQTGTATFRKQLQMAKSNVQWMKNYFAGIVDWLKANQK